MKANSLLLFCLMFFAVKAQTDTVVIDNGQLPANIFFEGYPFPKSNGGFHLNDMTATLNPIHQNLKLFYTQDSTEYSGFVKFINNGKRIYGQSHASFDEFLCTYSNGLRVYCEMKTYNRPFNKEVGVDASKSSWISAINLHYYSNFGAITDSIHYVTYNNKEQLLRESFSYSRSGMEIRNETLYVDEKIAFQGVYIDEKLDGKWKLSIETVTKKGNDTLISFYCLFKNDTLKDVLSDHCLFLGKKDEILDKSSFFTLYPTLQNGSDDFKFLSMSDQVSSISNDFNIILTVNKNYFNYGIPEKKIKRILRKNKH